MASVFSYISKWFRESRSVTNITKPTGMTYEEALALGFVVEMDGPETLSCVNRCVTLIANILSSVPVKVVRFNETKGWETVTDHPVHTLLNETSDVYDPYSEYAVSSNMWRYSSIVQMLLTGNSCLNITRNDRFQPISLRLNTSPRELKPRVNDFTLAQQYEFYDGFRGVQFLDKDQVLHFAHMPLDGFVGRSPIKIGLASFKTTGLAESRSQESIKKGRPEGFVKSPAALDDEKRKMIREEFEKTHTEERKRIGVLYGGMDWVPYGFSPSDLELIQTRKFQLDECCRWFGVPPHMVYSAEKNSYNLAAQLMVEFLQSTIFPMSVQLKYSMVARLFTIQERRRAKYDLYFDFDELFRYDNSTYLPGQTQRVQNGVITPNDWRDSERRIRVDGGERPIIMSSQFAPLASMFETTNPNKVMNPTDPTKPSQEKTNASPA